LKIFDLHVHTFFSKDSVNTPECILKVARIKGLSGFAVTDHDTTEGIGAFGNVKELIVVPGVEISTSFGHLLGLGIFEHPPRLVELREAVDFIHERGGIAVAAHPFSGLRMGMGKVLNEGFGIDGVEVFNASNWFGSNRRAALLSGFARTGGSDAHFPWEVGNGYTYGGNLNLADNWEDVLKAIKKGDTNGGGKLSPLSRRLMGRIGQKIGLYCHQRQKSICGGHGMRAEPSGC
jgi:predicted metal-dependent phosphoesterase TrpH